MKLMKGQKIMIVPEAGRHKEGKHKFGRIHSISKFNIVVDYKLMAWTGATWEEVKQKGQLA